MNMYYCNFGEYGSKLMTGAQVLRYRFEYAEKFESIKPVQTVSDLSLSDLRELQATKGELVKLFYGSNSGIDCALPLEYMRHLEKLGINTELLYRCAVMDCSGLNWQILPLCLEAFEEIEKIKQLV